jgi:Flp pilus assembly protein TadG
MKPASRKRQSGVAAIELAILMIPLSFMAFGAAEFGRAIYQYNTLVKSTRDAVRYLSSQAAGDPADVTIAKCLAVYGTTDCTGSQLVPGLTTAMVDVCDASLCPATHQAVTTGSGTINLVTVYIGQTTPFQFKVIVPLVMDNASSLTFNVISATMRQIS